MKATNAHLSTRLFAATFAFVGASAVLSGMSGCAPVMPPKELRDARASFNKAKVEATDAPLELDEARRALSTAEHRFEEIGADPEVAGLGFVADRKAQRAVALAHKVKMEHELAELLELEKVRLAEREARAKAEAEKARLETEKKERELAEANRARLEAESREANALAALKKVASGVRTEPRGLVVTFTGAVLFASNGAILTPAAKTRLDELVTVLERDKSKVVVEGHTDNQGTHAHNAALSKSRAEAVAAYFVKKGIAKERVRAEGVGEGRPLASNTNNDGRATNRRVEIVIEK